MYKLLAVDVPAASGQEQRLFVEGNDRIYNRGSVVKELRDPFLNVRLCPSASSCATCSFTCRPCNAVLPLLTHPSHMLLFPICCKPRRLHCCACPPLSFPTYPPHEDPRLYLLYSATPFKFSLLGPPKPLYISNMTCCAPMCLVKSVMPGLQMRDCEVAC